MTMFTIEGVFDGTSIRPLEAIHAQPNTRVVITFLEEHDSRGPFKLSRLEEVAGCLPYKGPALTIEQMDAAVQEAIGKEWRGHDRP